MTLGIVYVPVCGLSVYRNAYASLWLMFCFRYLIHMWFLVCFVVCFLGMTVLLDTLLSLASPSHGLFLLLSFNIDCFKKHLFSLYVCVGECAMCA